VIIPFYDGVTNSIINMKGLIGAMPAVSGHSDRGLAHEIEQGYVLGQGLTPRFTGPSGGISPKLLQQKPPIKS